MTLCRTFGDRDRSQFDRLPAVRPRNRGVVDLVALLGHLEHEFKLDGAASDPVADLIAKVVRSHLRDLLLAEELLAGVGPKLVTTERGNPLRVGKLERVDTEIRQGRVAHRWRLRGLRERFRRRMGAQELIQGGWL